MKITKIWAKTKDGTELTFHGVRDSTYHWQALDATEGRWVFANSLEENLVVLQGWESTLILLREWSVLQLTSVWACSQVTSRDISSPALVPSRVEKRCVWNCQTIDQQIAYYSAIFSNCTVVAQAVWTFRTKRLSMQLEIVNLAIDMLSWSEKKLRHPAENVQTTASRTDWR